MSVSNYLFVLGDSYTKHGFDVTGTLPSVDNPFGNPPYPGDNLSGGENWIDILVTDYMPPGTLAYDIAVGGASVNESRVGGDTSIVDMIKQTDQLTQLIQSGTSASGFSPDNSVVITWFGINDLVTATINGPPVDEARDAIINDVLDHYDQLERLYNLGLRQFLTILVPPIVRVPGYLNNDRADPACAIWNFTMVAGNGKFENEHPGAKVSYFDPTPTFNYILDYPGAFGAPDATCIDYPDGQPCLWHDTIHPGIQINKYIGRNVFTKLQDLNYVRGG